MGLTASTAMVAKGLLSWVPGIQSTFYDQRAAHGTGSAEYCYGVWLKHLAVLAASGMKDFPESVLELGPGESIGTGVAALLSGAERYVAIDAVPHMKPETNVQLFRVLVSLLQSRAPRSRGGFPALDPYLDERGFPSSALPEAHLASALDPRRLARIEHAVRNIGRSDPEAMIRYCTWSAPHPVPNATVDLVFSHVVLQHVDDLESVFANCGRFVRPGGWMSHQVDCTSLGTAPEWNGHFKYGDLAWKVIRGRRPYFINREPASAIVRMIESAGFDVVEVMRGKRPGGLTRDQLARRWHSLSDVDLATDTAFIVARRRPG